MIDFRNMPLKDILKEALRIKFMDERAYVDGTVLSDDDYLDFVMNQLMYDPDLEIARLQSIFNEFSINFSREN